MHTPSWRERLRKIAAPVGATLVALLLLAIAFGFLAFGLTIILVMIAALCVFVGLVYVAMHIFGPDRVEQWLTKIGIKITRAEEPSTTRHADDGIEDAIVLEETPPPLRRS